MKIRIFFTKTSYYLLLSLVICVLMKLAFQLPVRNFFEVYSTPLSYTGDTYGALITTQNFITGGRLYTIENLGAPFGWQAQSVIFSWFNLFLLYIGSIFTTNAALVLNILYLSSYPVIGIIAAYTLRKLNITSELSFLGGILYTFLPYHYLRNVWHIWLALYFMVPLICLISIRLMNGKGLKCHETEHVKNHLINKKMIVAIFACFVVGLGDTYLAYFSIICITFCSLFGAIKTKNKRIFFQGIILDISICFAFLIQILPVILLGKTLFSSEVSFRSFVDAEIYGLKIVQLLMPVNGHRVSFLSNIANIYNSSAPLVNENATASLGIFMSIGFLCSLFLGIFGRKFQKFELESDLGIFNIFIVLLASIGGFGIIISMFITSVIRCYNRLSVFIAFISLIVILMLIQKMYRFILNKITNIKMKSLMKMISFIILVLIAICGVFDQVSNYAIVNLPSQEWQSDEEFINVVEATVDEGSMIFELPSVGLQGGIYINNFLTYDIFKPYLHSTTLKWSASYSDGDICDHWNKYISSLSTQEMIDTLCYTGFNGIYIDSYAYTDTEFEELTSQIEAILGNEPIISENGRLYFYNTVNYKNLLIEKSLLNQSVSSDEGNQLIQYFYGWSDSSDGYKWTTDNTSNILCVLPDDIGNQITLTFDIIVPTQTEGLNLNIYAGNTSIYNAYVSSSGEVTLTVSNTYFTSSDLLSLTFYCDKLYDNSDIILDNNEQSIGFGIKSITISDK